ncbi:hypothetical protein GSI_02736 [Ganoderma sinense ZZ0214-1]|uniref:Uncharacterized protein n=1 Tax=Ganoderma sinense ZZ0214-1 TaxID=1077348 RepID=A0A2G8SMH5_9APHY|nr:hypothetical protein GSI_02736 [Ganoderma sinense ZZ0214-1]
MAGRTDYKKGESHFPSSLPPESSAYMRPTKSGQQVPEEQPSSRGRGVIRFRERVERPLQSARPLEVDRVQSSPRLLEQVQQFEALSGLVQDQRTPSLCVNFAKTYPQRPSEPLPSSPVVDRLRAVLAQAAPLPAYGLEEYGQEIEGLSRTCHRPDVWTYDWSNDYLQKLFSALNDVIRIRKPAKPSTSGGNPVGGVRQVVVSARSQAAAPRRIAQLIACTNKGPSFQ